VRQGAPKFISAWVVSRSGVTEINFGHRAGAGQGRTRGAAGCAEIHFGMGWGRTWGERKGAPKFISAWVVSRSGVTEINFGQRAGAGQGRTRGAAGCAEIHFGMGWGRTRGDREGAPKFISAWVGGGQGATEINFGQHAGAGRGRTRGERKGAPKFISAWVGGGQGATERVRRNLFRHGLGEDKGRAKGCAEIHYGLGEDIGRPRGCAEIYFGMGCEQKRGDRNKFRSTGRRGAGADAGRGRVRRNSFRHGLGEDKGRPRGCAEIYFGMGCEQKRGDRNKFRSPGRRGAGADAGCGRVRRNSFRHGLGEDMGRAKGCAEIHYGLGEDMGRPRGCAEIYFGMGCGQKRGDRNEFRSTGRRGLRAEMGCGRVRRNSFRHGLGEDMGRAKGCAEIHFGMGCEQKRGDRNKFRSTGRRGAGAGRGVRQGAPKFISAWVVSRSGVTEINFGQRAGAGRGRTRGAAGCAEIHFGMGWGRTWGERKGAPKFISAWVVSRSGVTEINFGQRAGAGRGRTRGAAGCAEIHFGMGCEQKRGDRNKFRSPGRRGAGADAGCGRVRRNSFRHGLGEDKGRPK
jgi:hypothetical protein